MVEPSDLASDIKVMRIAEEAKGWLKQELRRFREFVEESVRPTTLESELSVAGATLLDGGAPAAGLLGRVGPETWRAFEERFLCPEDIALLAL